MCTNHAREDLGRALNTLNGNGVRMRLVPHMGNILKLCSNVTHWVNTISSRPRTLSLSSTGVNRSALWSSEAIYECSGYPSPRGASPVLIVVRTICLCGPRGVRLRVICMNRSHGLNVVYSNVAVNISPQPFRSTTNKVCICSQYNRVRAHGALEARTSQSKPGHRNDILMAFSLAAPPCPQSGTMSGRTAADHR